MYKNVITGRRCSGKSTALAKLVACAATENNKVILVMGLQGGKSIRLNIFLELEKWNLQVVRTNINSITLDNDTMIYFKGLNTSLRGMTLDMLAIDDADEVSSEVIEGLIPCVKSQGTMITTTTVNVNV